MNGFDRLREGTKKALDDIALHAASDKNKDYYHRMAFKLINDSFLPRHDLVKWYYTAYHGYKEENRQG